MTWNDFQIVALLSTGVMWNCCGWSIRKDFTAPNEYDLYDPYGTYVASNSNPEALAQIAAQIDEAW